MNLYKFLVGFLAEDVSECMETFDFFIIKWIRWHLMRAKKDLLHGTFLLKSTARKSCTHSKRGQQNQFI